MSLVPSKSLLKSHFVGKAAFDLELGSELLLVISEIRFEVANLVEFLSILVAFGFCTDPFAEAVVYSLSLIVGDT